MVYTYIYIFNGYTYQFTHEYLPISFGVLYFEGQGHVF